MKHETRDRDPIYAGIGAIPHAAGVAFRVWAPGASALFHIGPCSASILSQWR